MKGGDRLFGKICCDRTRGNGSKLKEDRFRFDTRKKFFTWRVELHRNKLHGEVDDAPPLELFKRRLHGVLGNPT